MGENSPKFDETAIILHNYFDKKNQSVIISFGTAG
jgi:hypothetical protein